MRYEDGIARVFGDVCPQWHAATGKLLVTGKCFGFLRDANDNKSKDDRSQERVAYAVHDPETGAWTGMKIMEMPETDHEGKPILEPNAGCHQRVDLPGGDILLPVRYRKNPKARVYTTIVARCGFDGETLTYLEHGSEFNIEVPRGLYEPSVCEWRGRYYLTMRAEKTGYVASGSDGLNCALSSNGSSTTENRLPATTRSSIGSLTAMRSISPTRAAARAMITCFGIARPSSSPKSIPNGSVCSARRNKCCSRRQASISAADTRR